MTTAQHKIGSGFGARSTVHDVLRGIDPAGRLTLVTGGYSGLGLETTRALPTAGARVLVPARRVDVARKAVDGIGGVEVAGLDLGGLESTRTFAERFPASGRTLYIVINSAGIAVCPETRVGPGWEIQFAANHLGYYALVNRLWPAIERDGDRVVTVSSRGHRLSDIRWDDPHFTNGAYDKARTTRRVRQVGGVRPVEDRQRPVHRPLGCPRPGGRGTGVLAASRLWALPAELTGVNASVGHR